MICSQQTMVTTQPRWHKREFHSSMQLCEIHMITHALQSTNPRAMKHEVVPCWWTALILPSLNHLWLDAELTTSLKTSVSMLWWTDWTPKPRIYKMNKDHSIGPQRLHSKHGLMITIQHCIAKINYESLMCPFFIFLHTTLTVNSQ